jgi:hypothetical protein
MWSTLPLQDSLMHEGAHKSSELPSSRLQECLNVLAIFALLPSASLEKNVWHERI